jgi:hypothetical protein
MNEPLTYGEDLSDADYIAEMARLCDQNVGPPVCEHTARLRLISHRLVHLEGLARAVAGFEGDGRPSSLWWAQCQAFARGALDAPAQRKSE